MSLFGERKMIDESCCEMIDEMDTDIVDDIRDAKRRGAFSASHLCDEGHSHESTDRHMSATFNTTPRTSPYPQPKAQAAPSNTSPYPAPKMQQYTPQAAKHEARPVQTTVVNGRTYERPAEVKQVSPAQAKASKGFLALIIIGIVGSCMSSALVFPICFVLGMAVMGSAKKCEGDDTAKVSQTITVAVIAAIAVIVLFISGHLIFEIFTDLFSETGGLLNE